MLGRFAKADEKLLFEAFTHTYEALEEMIEKGIDTAMCHYN